MSGAGFILAINMFVAGLFSVAFFLVAANNNFQASFEHIIHYLTGMLIKCNFCIITAWRHSHQKGF